DPKRRTMTWPGPRILVTGAEGQPSRDWIASAEVYYLVVDLLVAPVSRFDALRNVLNRAARARINLRGPLLFSNKAIPDNEVGRLEQAVRDDPWLIEATADPVDGKFTMLVLGESVVTNPLFKNFFGSLHEGVTEMQTGNCITLMQEHLVWRREGQTE
ncbi:hypothetical protein, partial [Sulfitobacter sp. HI0076]